MYFAALLARTEDGWEASDTELDDVETLSDLTDLAREASVDEDTVLVFIEQEDAWFGVVRVDGEEDPRIYVSDASAAARSSYGEILLTDELLGREPGAEDTIAALEELVGLDGTEDGEPTPADNDTTDNDDEDDDGPGAGVVPGRPDRRHRGPVRPRAPRGRAADAADGRPDRDRGRAGSGRGPGDRPLGAAQRKGARVRG